jgi:hypothetical protein
MMATMAERTTDNGDDGSKEDRGQGSWEDVAMEVRRTRKNTKEHERKNQKWQAQHCAPRPGQTRKTY